MSPGTVPASCQPTPSLATQTPVRRALNIVGVLFTLLTGLLVAGCSVTIGPQPVAGTPLPGQPTNTPIQQVQVDITRVATPTESPPTPTAGPVGEPTEYTIKSGDSLSVIAVQFGVTVDEIVRFNNLPDPNQIYEGQHILIPPPSSGQPAATTTGAETPVVSGNPTATMVP